MRNAHIQKLEQQLGAVQAVRLACDRLQSADDCRRVLYDTARILRKQLDAAHKGQYLDSQPSVFH